ncbi:MAG: hypothetical protein EOO46_17605 [Flavobacterium sp.]|nr:MAG: hypothetical protein EOO46_17605 [Flavobacterium sp.]
MKKTILIMTVLLFSFYQMIGQNNVNSSQFFKARDTIICFNCSSEQSTTVKKFTELILDKKYLEIKKLMQSGNAAERFLAAVACQKASSRKLIYLTKDDEKKISEIFNSQSLIYAYSNDTYIQIKPIKFYVHNREDRIIWAQAQRWLDKILK